MGSPPTEHATEYVYVPVPLGKVEDVFRFLAGLTPQGSEVGTDLDRTVRRVYLESEEHFRDLLRFLAGRAGQPVSTGDVAEALGLPNGAASLAGMLGAFARRSKNRYGGYWPFERVNNPGLDRSELMMEDNVAAIVNALDTDA
jgi:hypothetical protein